MAIFELLDYIVNEVCTGGPSGPSSRGRIKPLDLELLPKGREFCTQTGFCWGGVGGGAGTSFQRSVTG